MFDELALPITTMASASAAIACSAACRLVVAKHRSLRAAVHSSGKAARARSMMPSQSCIESVVCARSATFDGSSTVGQHLGEVVLVLDQPDGVGRDREGAGGLVVAARGPT